MKKSILFALPAVLLWSTLTTVVKLVLANIPNFEVLTIAGFLAFALLLIMNIVTGKIKLLKAFRPMDYVKLVALSFLGMFVYHVLYYYGIKVLSAQEACILNYLWPIMIIIFSIIILKEKMTLMKGLAVLCSFVGVIILTLGGGTFSGTGSLVGVLACLGAAVSYGLFSVLNKKVCYDQQIAMMFYWLVVGVMSLIFGLLTEDWVSLDGMAWGGILWLSLLVDAVSYLLWATGLNSAKNTAVVANLAYLTPFLSVVFAGIFLKEEVKPSALIALIFIVGGILMQTFFDGRKTA